LSDWKYAQSEPSDRLCKLHHFSMMRPNPEGEVEFFITVREYVDPPDPAMRFFAQADKEVSRGVAPHRPVGWGPDLLTALSECVKAVRRFT
jgi:hypothetical protein